MHCGFILFNEFRYRVTISENKYTFISPSENKRSDIDRSDLNIPA
jgi:hypothetical protein